MILFVLILLWITLSGYFTFLPLIPGLISIPLIVFVFKKAQIATAHTSKFKVNIFQFLLYIPYIIKEIYYSNLNVAKIILTQSFFAKPKIIQINNDFHNNSLATIFTNSTTLTPGSITLIATENKFIIHCITSEIAESFDKQEMQNKINKLGIK